MEWSSLRTLNNRSSDVTYSHKNLNILGQSYGLVRSAEHRNVKVFWPDVMSSSSFLYIFLTPLSFLFCKVTCVFFKPTPKVFYFIFIYFFWCFTILCGLSGKIGYQKRLVFG